MQTLQTPKFGCPLHGEVQITDYLPVASAPFTAEDCERNEDYIRAVIAHNSCPVCYNELPKKAPRVNLFESKIPASVVVRNFVKDGLRFTITRYSTTKDPRVKKEIYKIVLPDELFQPQEGRYHSEEGPEILAANVFKDHEGYWVLDAQLHKRSFRGYATAYDAVMAFLSLHAPYQTYRKWVLENDFIHSFYRSEPKEVESWIQDDWDNMATIEICIENVIDAIYLDW